MELPVYLDNASTTPLDPRVADAMVRCLQSSDGFGNPSTDTHELGRKAKVQVEAARDQVAALINASRDEIIWTSGATESDNLALMGAANYRRVRGHHLVTSATEHKAVLSTCQHLERQGFRVTYLEPDRHGLIAPEAVEAAIASDTILVSIMHANNEIGVVHDIAGIGAVCREADVLFHVDAAQSAGRLPLDVQRQCIDLLSVTAHKLYGPKGIGALFLNRQRLRRIEPLMHGGAQERGLRPGTLPTHQIVGMGEAFELAASDMDQDTARIASLRDRLWDGIRTVPGVILNGHPKRRLCSILCVSVSGVEGESLMFGLRDLAVTSGAACNAAADEPSYVLRSLGRCDQLAHSSIRFSLGRFTTAEEVDFAAASFRQAVDHLHRMLPDRHAIATG
jgi:cysteine desulfurase